MIRDLAMIRVTHDLRLNFVGILLNSRLSHARTNPESYESINHAGDDPV